MSELAPPCIERGERSLEFFGAKFPNGDVAFHIPETCIRELDGMKTRGTVGMRNRLL